MKSYYDKMMEDIIVDDNVKKTCPIPEGYNEKVWEHEISEERKNKLWALEKKTDDVWWNKASYMSKGMLLNMIQDDVCDMAKKSYDYFYHRSHAKNKGSIYGWGGGWLDPEWYRKWKALTGEEIPEEDIKWI